MDRVANKRQAVRHQIKMPIHYDHGIGVTCDVSHNGVYFITDHHLEIGQDLHFLIELVYAIPGKSLRLTCNGQVLRVEECPASKFGIAAKFGDIHYLH